MGFTGELKSIDLTAVLQTVSLNVKTGTLKIYTSRQVAFLFFEKGQITIFASSEEKPVQLGSLLLSWGKLTQGALETALDRGLLGKRHTERAARPAARIRGRLGASVQNPDDEIVSTDGQPRPAGAQITPAEGATASQGFGRRGRPVVELVPVRGDHQGKVAPGPGIDGECAHADGD